MISICIVHAGSVECSDGADRGTPDVCQCQVRAAVWTDAALGVKTGSKVKLWPSYLNQVFLV